MHKLTYASGSPLRTGKVFAQFETIAYIHSESTGRDS